MFLISSCSCLCPIYWCQALSREWRCSWSSADRQCSNYIWVINSVITYWGASYIKDLTWSLYCGCCWLVNSWLHRVNGPVSILSIDTTKLSAVCHFTKRIFFYLIYSDNVLFYYHIETGTEWLPCGRGHFWGAFYLMDSWKIWNKFRWFLWRLFLVRLFYGLHRPRCPRSGH